MTPHLQDLLYNYGLLHVSTAALDQARRTWVDAHGSVNGDEEAANTPLGEDEPALLVRISEDQDPHFHPPRDREITIAGQVGATAKQVAVLELPEDEFHYFRAFHPGLKSFSREIPSFFHGMCLAYAQGLFEGYTGEVLKSIIRARPEMLGKSKTLTYGEILESYPAMAPLLEHMIEREVRELLYKGWQEILTTLRERHGFRDLTDTHDLTVVELTLVRNCIVHNRGIVDARLEHHSGGRYVCGAEIHVSQTLVFDAISLFRQLASEIDAIAESRHLKK